MKPYWLGSIHFNRTVFRSFSITMPSATLEGVDVRDIGLRSLLKSSIDFSFGKGEISAN